MKKGLLVFSVVLFLALCMVLSSIALAEERVVSPLIKTLDEVEHILYGIPQSGSVLGRVEDVERDLIGDTLSGTLMERVERLKTFVLTGSYQEPSLEFKIKSIRLALDADLAGKGVLFKEIEELEREIFGYESSGPLGVRVDNLFRTIVDVSRIEAFTVPVPAETLVKIAIETNLNSERNNVDDPVPYVLIEDLTIEGVLVATRGTWGEGRIDSIRRKGHFGRPGRIIIDFETIRAIDGTPVGLELGKRAIQENKSRAYAVGASIAGLAILGPVGAVAGFFVHGEPAVVEKGSEFFVEVAEEVEVAGQLARSAIMQPAYEDPFVPGEERIFPTMPDEKEDDDEWWARPIYNDYDEYDYDREPPLEEPEDEEYFPEVEIEIRPLDEDWGTQGGQKW